MRRSVALFCFLAAAAAASVRAQVVPAASDREFSIIVGGEGSMFQPDFKGNWAAENSTSSYCSPTSVCKPFAEISPYPLFGYGAYIDVRVSRRVQIEAEARWLHDNEYTPYALTNGAINQDHYLAGPRFFLLHKWRTTVSGKILFGMGKMNLGGYPGLCETTYCVAHGQFTAVAFGGGADFKLSKRFYLRAIDVEYQYWPSFGANALAPFGISAGLGYKIF